MLAVHLDNLLFILLIAGIGLLRLLAKKAGGTTEDDQAPPPATQAPRGQATQTDEERIRKFLEALGQPTSSRPPPPVRPRPAAPVAPEVQGKQMEEAARAARRRKLLNPLPPLTTVPPPLPSPPRRVIMPREVPPPPLPVAPARAIAPVYEVSPPRELAPPPRAQPASGPSAEGYGVIRPVSAAPAAVARAGALFASRDDLRRAIILREVFGPPRGLQPLDAIGG